MREVKEFVSQLPEREHTYLANAIGSGLHDARMAAQCLTDPGPQSRTVPQLLAYLTRSINELTSVRELITRRLEGMETQPSDRGPG